MRHEKERIPEEEKLLRLQEGVGQIEEIAWEWQLDPFPITFELISPTMVYELAAYGVPEHFSHWTHGRAFWEWKTRYNHGLAKIYEMVVNANPSIAVLSDDNSIATNLMVAAHVVPHVDFFKNNYLFKETWRNMPEMSAVRSERITDYEQEYGRLEVEKFLDSVLALAEHIEPMEYRRLDKDELLAAWKKEFYAPPMPRKPRFKDVPVEESPAVGRRPDERMPIPLHPQRDLLGFLRDFAPYLEDWQRDIVDIVREESYYFYPQMRTKIMNEGWAVFWHTRIMHEMSRRGYVNEAASEGWIHLHAGVAEPRKSQLNPYWFGMVMWEWLFDYYNGQLTASEEHWLRQLGWTVYPLYEGPIEVSPGLKKIREIMMTNDDISFIRNYFNLVPAQRMGAYLWDVFGDEEEDQIVYISSTNWEDVKRGLLDSFAEPYIEVVNSDYEGRMELLLEHTYLGRELSAEYIEKTLPHVYRIWQRPVHLRTIIKNKQTVFSAYAKEVRRS